MFLLKEKPSSGLLATLLGIKNLLPKFNNADPSGRAF
jgi:hypothetical protein